MTSSGWPTPQAAGAQLLQGMRHGSAWPRPYISDPSSLLYLADHGSGPHRAQGNPLLRANLRNAGKTLLISSHDCWRAEMISAVPHPYEGVLRRGPSGRALLQREIALEVDGLTPELVTKSPRPPACRRGPAGERGKLRARGPLSAYDAIRRWRELGLNCQCRPEAGNPRGLFVRVIGAAKTSRSA
jgi:hypothetical protein